MVSPGFVGRVTANTTVTTDDLSVDKHGSKAEQDIISKLRPCMYIADFKSQDKTTYRDFICGMNKVLQFIINICTGAKGYSAHMLFITSKATVNL